MGHVSAAAVFGGEGGLTGQSVQGFAINANTMSIGGKSLRDEANPTTPFNLTGKGGGWGCLIKLDADDEPSWVRTFEDSGSTNTVKPRGGDVSGNLVVVGGFAQTSVPSILIKDDAGTTLSTISQPAGTYNGWAWAAVLTLDTGSVVWSSANGWTGDPGSTVARCQMSKIFFGGENRDRIYATGYYRTSNVSAGSANLHVPTWNGVQVPAVTLPIGAYYMSGSWMFEIDPANGNGLDSLACDKFVSSPSQGHQSKSPGGVFTTRGGMWDTVNNKIHFAEGHMGSPSSGSGGITIGRGQAGSFTTRDFVDWNSDGDYIRPWMGRFDEEMLPEVAVTQAWDVIVSNNSPGDTFIPAVMSDGSMIWATHNQGTSTSRNIDRDGGGGSYGTSPAPESNPGALSIYRIPADYGSPVWSQSLALPTVSNNNAWNVRAFDSGTNIIVMLTRHVSTITTVSIIGTPAVPANWFDTYVVVLNRDTGAFVRKSYLKPVSTTDYAKIVEAQFVTSGPHANQLRTISGFTMGAGTAGIEDDTGTGTIVFDALSTWAMAKNPAGLGVFMSVFDSSGLVDEPNCWTLASGSSSFQYDTFMSVEC